MTTDYRAMCAELLKALESWSPGGGGPLEDADEIAEAHLIDRARALLDQPVAVAPTDEELWELYDDKLGQFGFAEDWPWIRNYARAVLARWSPMPSSGVL